MNVIQLSFEILFRLIFHPKMNFKGDRLRCFRLHLCFKTPAGFVMFVRAILRLCHSSGSPPRRLGFEPRSGHVGIVVDKVALGQVFSEYFGFPYQFSFHRLLHIHHLSSGAGTISQLVADVPSGLSLSPQKKKIGKMQYCNLVPT
jgi:hypothetical protein